MHGCELKGRVQSTHGQTGTVTIGKSLGSPSRSLFARRCRVKFERPPPYLLSLLYGRHSPVEYPRYSRSEEAALAAASAFNDESAIVARNELVLSCVPLAVGIALKTGIKVFKDDLVDEAVLFLFRAVQYFDPTRGRLTVLVTKIVTDPVRNYYCRYELGIVSGPRSFNWKYLREKTQKKVQAAKRLPSSIEFFDAAKGEVPVAERLDHLLDLGRLQTWIDKCLNPREKEIIHQRFYKDQTRRAIGQSLGLTRERIRQIEKKSLDKLRKAAGVTSTEV